MASKTAQIVVGHSHVYHGGIYPTHTAWLSENSRPAWELEPTRESADHSAEEPADEESPAWAIERLVWVPGAPEHILEDGILLIAARVLCDEGVLNLAESRLPELLEAEYLDLTQMDVDALDDLRQQCWNIELDCKLVVTVLGGSSLEGQLPVLERWRPQVEVCTVTYSRVWGGMSGPSDAQISGSLRKRQ